MNLHMHDFSAAHIKKMVIHHVGNKANEERLTISEHHVRTLQVEEEDKLLKYFLKPFQEDDYYSFDHHSDLELNETYSYIHELFITAVNFIEASQRLARHLYANSNHPRIKGGEFYVVHFGEMVFEGELVEAVGLFKSEKKSTFMNVHPSQENFDLSFNHGIDLKKLDKGCIIFNTYAEEGYRLLIHDALSKGDEARYWKDEFIGAANLSTAYSMTKNYMNMCRSFVTEELPTNFEVDRATQIQMLNRSSGYFTEQEEISTETFASEVLEAPEVIDTFNAYKERYAQEHHVEIEDQFEPSKQAVRSGKKFFKSVLKLDKNFHIYVHGNPDRIEQGFDETRGLKFYKVYYEEERE
jgi:hypothetical protein